MKRLALSAINLYQHLISPHKGFVCAYRAHTGRGSCSVLAYRAIQRFGIWRGVGILRERLGKCGIAHRRYAGTRGALHRQAGFCDLSCDLPCDLDLGSAACDALSNCGSPCDCGDWRFSRKKQQEEQWVHIPPSAERSRPSKTASN